MKRYKQITIITVLCGMFTTSALSYEAGDLFIKVGVGTIDPREMSTPLALPGIGDVGQLLGTETSVGLNSDTKPVVFFTYMLSDHFGVETFIAPPPEHNVSTKGLEPINISTLGEFKHIPATVSLQYYPLNKESRFQPYWGIGINYTYFFDEETPDSLNSSVSAENTELRIEPAFGLTAHIGLNYNLNEYWFVNVAAYYIDLETDGELKITDSALLGGNATLETTVDIDPMSYFLMIGYQF